MADQIIIEYGAKVDKLEADLRKVESSLKGVEGASDKSMKELSSESNKAAKQVSTVTKEVRTLDSRLGVLAGQVASVFAAGAIMAYGKQVVEITAKFQKFEAVLTNTLGSRSAAQKALELIKKFAAETPFAVDELTASYVKLANQGFKPTADEMRKLGDLASSQGKSFDQLTEAIIDAQTGEFERLKEFGIRASKEGDKVKFTFKGVQTQTDFTAASIRKYILSLGDLEGVSGGMSAISKTLGGQLSNLGDTFDSLLLSIGAMTSGTVSGFIAIIGRAAESLRDFITPTVDVKEQLALTRIEFNKEIEVLKTANYSQEQRARAIREINEKYKDYLPNLISETASLQEIEKAQKGVNDAITERILMTAFEEEITELIKVQKSSAESLYKTEKARAQQKKETNAIDLRQIEVQTKQFKNLDEINKAVIESSTKQIDEIDEKYQALATSLGVSWAKIRQQIEDAKKVTEIQGPKFSEKEIAEYNKAMARAAKISEIIASRQTDFRAKTEVDFTEIQKKEEKKRHASRLKDMKAFQKEYLDPMVQASKEASDKQLKIDVDRIHAQRKLRMSLLMQGIETLGDTLNTIREMEQQNLKAEIDAEIEKERTKTDNQLANLDKRREAGIISETQYEAQKERIQQTAKKKENDLRRKQFEAEKKSAITRVNIETAVAIAKTVATMGFIPALPFIPFVIAQGELQKVTIRNQKFTGYKDGVIDLQGKGTGTSDSIPAKLSKGESVMTAEETKEFKPLFTAIRKNKFDEYINKNYLEPIKKKAEEKQREALRRSESMEGLMKEMVLNSFNTSHLERLTKKNKSVKIENVRDLGKEIGKYVKPQSSRGL